VIELASGLQGLKPAGMARFMSRLKARPTRVAAGECSIPSTAVRIRCATATTGRKAAGLRGLRPALQHQNLAHKANCFDWRSMLRHYEEEVNGARDRFCLTAAVPLPAPGNRFLDAVVVETS
jgi:hypothetical protein